MARDRSGNSVSPESVISIIAPGMKVVGDCDTDGTIRIEGSVQGTVRAGKAVVVGKDGFVAGDIVTQDAVVSGAVTGTLVVESRLELQATCRIDGDVRARRLQLDEGAILNGSVHMGDVLAPEGGPSDKAETGAADASSNKQTSPQSVASPQG